MAAGAGAGAAGKQAVVFILDSSFSMGHTPYYTSTCNSSDDPTDIDAGGGGGDVLLLSKTSASASASSTRLDCAKQALQVWISDLMIQSKQHEVAVVVCKTATTNHPYLNNEHFPNLTLLPLHVVQEEQEGQAQQQEQQEQLVKVVVADDNDDSSAANNDNDNDDDDDIFINSTTTNTNKKANKSIGMTRPTVSLLRQVQHICCSEPQLRVVEVNNNNKKDNTTATTTPPTTAPPTARQQMPLLRGDLMDGLVVAADALRRRTLGKKYERSIVLLTDACHEVAILDASSQILQVVDSLRAMDCQLHVIGLDFKESAIFDTALPESEAANEEGDQSDGEQENDDDDDEDDDDDYDSDKSVDHHDEQLVRSANQLQQDTERFLISVARLTGGSVRAASSLHQVLQQNLGKRIPTSTRRKVQLLLLPASSSSSSSSSTSSSSTSNSRSMQPLDVRVSLLLSKTSLPTLKKEAILLDEQNVPLQDGMGNYVTSELETATDHFDAIQKDIGVDEAARTKAVKYGSDWIPLNDFDVQGLKERSDCCITILGYTPQSNIERAYRMGPPYGVAGSEHSVRARAAVGALAQALHRLQLCAIGTYVKSKHADPILVALFPLVSSTEGTVVVTNEPTTRMESDDDDDSTMPSPPHHLVLLQLPYRDDVPKMGCPPLDVYAQAEKQQTCDALIDSMMLEPHELDSTVIPNPAIRSFRKTLVQRAISSSVSTNSCSPSEEATNKNAPTVVNARGEWFNVPFLEEAAPAMNAFRKTFPITSIQKTS